MSAQCDTRFKMRIAIFLVSTLALSSAAKADTLLDTAASLFETACVGSGLKPDLIRPLAATWADATGFQMVELPEGLGVQIMPDSVEVWGHRKDSEAIIAGYGKTEADGDVRYNCRVSISGASREDAIDILANGYDVSDWETMKQGSSTFDVYRTSLVGYSRQTILFIQAGMGNVSLGLAHF